MLNLTMPELKCLSKVAEGPSALEPCPEAILNALIGKGLVEHTAIVPYPLQCSHNTYHLTPAGYALLHQD